MAFNKSSPADLLALKTEVNTDPILMGYDLSGNTTKLLDLLNIGASNVGGETIGENFTARLLLEVIEANDLTVGGQFTQGELEWLKLLIETTQHVDEDISDFKAKFEAVMTGNTATLGALAAKVRLLSRAEVLFGTNTVITRNDWIASRDS